MTGESGGTAVRSEVFPSHNIAHVPGVQGEGGGGYGQRERFRMPTARPMPDDTSDRLSSTASRALQIRDFCLERAIPSLVHFTRQQNLQSILQHGLLSRLTLEKLPWDQPPRFNDPHRLDECREAVCLSMAFPNYTMFYKYTQSDPADWVVLLLERAILWEFDCAFCRENAAANEVRRLPLSQRIQLSALKDMFADYPGMQRYVLDIPSSYPTHPQAEVLVFASIPPRYITAVHFSSWHNWQQWSQRHPNAHLSRGGSGEKYFRPRHDWRHWQSDQL